MPRRRLNITTTDDKDIDKPLRRSRRLNSALKSEAKHEENNATRESSGKLSIEIPSRCLKRGQKLRDAIKSESLEDKDAMYMQTSFSQGVVANDMSRQHPHRTKIKRVISTDSMQEDRYQHRKKARLVAKKEIKDFSSSGSEDEWEEVEDIPSSMKTSRLPDGLEFVIDASADEVRKESKWDKIVRLEVNRTIKERQINYHKIYLLCYIAHLRSWTKSLVNSEFLSQLCLSLIPQGYVRAAKNGVFNEAVAERFMNWFKSAFIPASDAYAAKSVSPNSQMERLERLISEKCYEFDRDVASILFLCLLSLGLSIRLCLSCQPVQHKVSFDSLHRPKATSSGSQEAYVSIVHSRDENKSMKLEKKKRHSHACKKTSNRESNELKSREGRVSKDPNSAPLITCNAISKYRNSVKAHRDYWVEYWDEATDRWICVDPWKGKVDYAESMEKDASYPMHYVLAIDQRLGMRDVTARYASKYLSNEVRRLRVNPEWWDETMRIFQSKNRARNRKETVEVHDRLCAKPLPTTIAELKNHPLYVLKKDLLKFEAIYPEDQKPVGQVKDVDVYPRSSAHHLQGSLNWIKQARSIKPGEKPYKTVKARPNLKVPEELREPRSLEVYGYWQTEPYKPPEIIDDTIPRNEFGNIYLYKRCMLPKKCLHMRLDGLVSIARKLNIDCVPAVVGWEFHKCGNHPVLDGCVVLAKHEKTLRQAWTAEYERKSAAAVKRRKERALKNWRRFIKGLFTLKHVRAKFGVGQGHIQNDSALEGKCEELMDESADFRSEMHCWPRTELKLPHMGDATRD